MVAALAKNIATDAVIAEQLILRYNHQNSQRGVLRIYTKHSSRLDQRPPHKNRVGLSDRAFICERRYGLRKHELQVPLRSETPTDVP